uniref:(northern house mosquito) hypothetical protein n=1 Tax=Culex pipiens TaxID=7175 RepID=A0A8D8K3I2_CULPI
MADAVVRPVPELAVLLRVGTVQPAVRADLSGRMLLRTACFSPLVVRSADQQWRRTGLQGHQGGEATALLYHLLPSRKPTPIRTAGFHRIGMFRLDHRHSRGKLQQALAAKGGTGAEARPLAAGRRK